MNWYENCDGVGPDPGEVARIGDVSLCVCSVGESYRWSASVNQYNAETQGRTTLLQEGRAATIEDAKGKAEQCSPDLQALWDRLSHAPDPSTLEKEALLRRTALAETVSNLLHEAMEKMALPHVPISRRTATSVVLQIQGSATSILNQVRALVSQHDPSHGA
jgi:hypothetical protein